MKKLILTITTLCLGLSLTQCSIKSILDKACPQGDIECREYQAKMLREAGNEFLKDAKMYEQEAQVLRAAAAEKAEKAESAESAESAELLSDN
jgi:hypothetical protein